MLEEVQQFSLRWPTPSRWNPRKFRNAVGFALGKLTHKEVINWGWLFNSQDSQPKEGQIATVRFVTGNGAKGSFAEIVAIGDETCARMSSVMSTLLPAVRLAGIAQSPIVNFDRLWIKPSASPHRFRLQTVVLTRLKGDEAFYDRHRADPSLIVPYLKDAVSKGINRQVAAVGLYAPMISDDDVNVVRIDELGTQPISKGRRDCMLSRLTQAEITLPCRLNGDWRVGGLLTYGNGLVSPIANEKHWRTEERERQPYPLYEREENAA